MYLLYVLEPRVEDTLLYLFQLLHLIMLAVFMPLIDAERHAPPFLPDEMLTPSMLPELFCVDILSRISISLTLRITGMCMCCPFLRLWWRVR